MKPPPSQDLLKTPLDGLHREIGGRMVPFAGYAMPVQYTGIIAEHTHTREAASLFDVSHMGQAVLRGGDPLAALEELVPADLRELDPGRQRYTVLTNERGGILDDLMIARTDSGAHLVVNAACKDADFAHIARQVNTRCDLDILAGRALLALQGPAAAAALTRHAPDVADMPFMSFREIEINGEACFVSRSGYTGEDGFEISVPNGAAEALARLFLDEPEVQAAGLGARDSLRLEAGLCLYGNDIDETTTPVEAGLTWTIGKRRRARGGFPGDDVIRRQIEEGAPRKRVGLRPAGKAPVRSHARILDATGADIGAVTSGGFGPSVGGPVAMGYVAGDHAEAETPVKFSVRDRIVTGTVAKLPFVKHRYFKS